jgi:hypothetical protein
MLTIRPAVLGDARAMIEVHRAAVLAKAVGHYSRAILDAWAPGATDGFSGRPGRPMQPGDSREAIRRMAQFDPACPQAACQGEVL